MSEAAITSKGRTGRGKKPKEDVEEVEKAQDIDVVTNKKGASKRKNTGKKDEETTVEENGQTELTVTTAPPKKAARGFKGKPAKIVDDDVEEVDDGDEVPVESQPPKRGSRARKEVVYKEVDEDVDNKKKRGAAKPETKAVPPKKTEKKSTKSKAALAKTKKKTESEAEDEEEDVAEKESGGEEGDQGEEKEETASAIHDSADDDTVEEEVPPTKKARGGRPKPAAKKESDKALAVVEKAPSRKRGGKKNEEVTAVKMTENEVAKIKRGRPKADLKTNVVREDEESKSSVVAKSRVVRVAKSRSKTPGLENITIRKDKPKSKSKLKRVPEEDATENETAQNITMRKAKTTTKRKKSTTDNVSDGEILDSKQMKPYELTKVEKDYNLTISTWNVAGIRAWLGKGGPEFIRRENPDIICLQETKCLEEDMPAVAKIVGYHPYYLCKTGGYAGIAIYSKIMPMKIIYGIGDSEFDQQGRIMTAEYEKFFLVCVYVPNSGRKLVNLEKRMQWNKLFLRFVTNLDGTASKPVIICGDMNVSHLEIDLANPKANKRNAGFTQEERDDMTELLSNGFVDTFRHLYPDKKDCYTYWTYMSNSRARNVGWRLDYFIVSERMTSRIVDNVIRSEVHGSDHCPITLFLNMNKLLV